MLGVFLVHCQLNGKSIPRWYHYMSQHIVYHLCACNHVQSIQNILMLQGQVVPEVQSTNLISTRCRYRCKGCQKGAIGFRSDHWWYVFGCLYSWSASFIVLLGFFMRLKTLCLRVVNFHAIGLVWRQMPSSSPGILIDRYVSTKCRSIEYGFHNGFHMLSLAFHLFYLSVFYFTSVVSSWLCAICESLQSRAWAQKPMDEDQELSRIQRVCSFTVCASRM